MVLKFCFYPGGADENDKENMGKSSVIQKIQSDLILAVLRSNLWRVAGPSPQCGTWVVSYTALKKRRSGGEPLATLCPI